MYNLRVGVYASKDYTFWEAWLEDDTSQHYTNAYSYQELIVYLW